MASMISLASKTQQSYASLRNKDDAIKCSLPEIDIDYPIIAKGNIIGGIKAKK